MAVGRILKQGSTLGSVLFLAMFAWNIRFVLFFGSEGSSAAPNNEITVLIWHWPFLKPMNISGDVCLNIYNIQDCRLTDDRKMFNRSNVVVFHHRELNTRGHKMPAGPRPPQQMWVLATLESPSNTKGLWKWNNTFNWTLTYHEDSDIFAPYGQMVHNLPMALNDTEKTGLVSWVVSNYRHVQERVKFFKRFSLYQKVDVYGKASRRPLCPSCLLSTMSKYLFYLALENSVHKDYITEKLWRNAFHVGAVPIVLGPPRENYEKFIPSDSFIHVSDFPSPKHLSDFIGTITPQRYKEFFRWRQDYGVKLYNDWRERFCMICAKYPSLNKTKVYADIEGWYNSENVR
ncbi:alpha-(1,3)-fucosyltransferase 7 [Hyla sarda]|uniref:alpha-(1,3)-fucosyltransferase 7 n=1 Tax=Hyla sarda TaxID=327740 RepID=UPI0024C46C44|nr:alpha-(1,3)-fucosyltransferase 7 [Hyla sarda]